jgi:hypothetical protein
MPNVVYAPGRQWSRRERAMLLALLAEVNVLRVAAGLPVLTPAQFQERLAQMYRREN